MNDQGYFKLVIWVLFGSKRETQLLLSLLFSLLKFGAKAIWVHRLCVSKIARDKFSCTNGLYKINGYITMKHEHSSNKPCPGVGHVTRYRHI